MKQMMDSKNKRKASLQANMKTESPFFCHYSYLLIFLGDKFNINRF